MTVVRAFIPSAFRGRVEECPGGKRVLLLSGVPLAGCDHCAGLYEALRTALRGVNDDGLYPERALRGVADNPELGLWC